jgi:hypothetical protein
MKSEDMCQWELKLPELPWFKKLSLFQPAGGMSRY